MSSRALKRRFLPYPEIVESDPHPSPYRIIDSKDKKWLPSNGITNKLRREMLVPLHPSGRSIARHELGHVKWSPQRIPEVRYDPRVLMAVEDARVNLGLAWQGVPVLLSHGDRGQVIALAAEDLDREDPFTFLIRAIASAGTNVEDGVMEAGREASPAIARIAEQLSDRVNAELISGRRDGPVAPFTQVEAIAERMARELEALGLLKNIPESIAADAACCLRLDPESSLDRRRRVLEAMAHYSGRPRGRAPDSSGEPIDPGAMTVSQAPLTIACGNAGRGRGRERRPATEGSQVRALHRWSLDRAIFHRSRPRPGGTVLVDTSNSMSLAVADLERLVARAPATTLVAIYSGKGRAGELRIVARSGRRASADHLSPFGKGNIVDVPALEWLSRQTPPRIWISDGKVTGVGDSGSPAIDERCEEICRRARIRRVDTLDEGAALVGSAGNGRAMRKG